MQIICIDYLKHGSNFEGNTQWVNIEWMIRATLSRIQKGFEHINWIGIVDNLFTGDVMIYALIFYNGKWDGKKLIDKLITDMKDPQSDDPGMPSPFSSSWEKVNFDRKLFINKLKGGEIF